MRCASARGKEHTQVAMIARIYPKARRVVIDIGEESYDSNDGLHCRQNCRQDVLYEFWDGLQIRIVISNLYSRPFFWRVWVLQEIFRFKKALFMCGSTIVPWDTFKPFTMRVGSRWIGLTEETFHILNAVPQSLQIGKHTWLTYHAVIYLLGLLVRGRTCESTDPQDNIIALLSMLREVPVEIQAESYSKTVVDVYTDTTKYLLLTTGLKFLVCVAHFRPRNMADNVTSTALADAADMPSSVPDLRQKIIEGWMIGYGNTYHPLSAGGDTSYVAQVLPNHGPRPCLQIRGREVDIILRITGEDVEIRAREEYHEIETNRFLHRCIWYRARISNPATLPEPPYLSPGAKGTGHVLPSWLVYRLGLPIKGATQYTENELIDKFSMFPYGRSLTLTDGYVGIVPKTARAGHVICSFLGANIPFALRHTDESDKNQKALFVLVGECYIYGLMEGEAFSGIDTGQAFKLKDFLIAWRFLGKIPPAST